MGGHRSRRPSINTSADAVLRRLDHEFTIDPLGPRDFVRAHLRTVALGALLAGTALAGAAVLAPMLVALVGCVTAVTGIVMATLVADDDRVTGLGRARRWSRRTTRRLRPRCRHRCRTERAPMSSRLAPWLFPDPRGRGR